MSRRDRENRKMLRRVRENRKKCLKEIERIRKRHRE